MFLTAHPWHSVGLRVRRALDTTAQARQCVVALFPSSWVSGPDEPSEIFLIITNSRLRTQHMTPERESSFFQFSPASRGGSRGESLESPRRDPGRVHGKGPRRIWGWVGPGRVRPTPGVSPWRVQGGIQRGSIVEGLRVGPVMTRQGPCSGRFRVGLDWVQRVQGSCALANFVAALGTFPAFIHLIKSKSCVRPCSSRTRRKSLMLLLCTNRRVNRTPTD